MPSTIGAWGGSDAVSPCIGRAAMIVDSLNYIVEAVN
jgi:hypothetical protein